MASRARHLLVCLALILPLAAQRDLKIERINVQNKRALVIGNSAYPQSPLQNPVHDAARMSSVLRSLGFNVEEGHDLTRRLMEDVIDRFTSSIQPGDLALFYYAGHGVQIDQENYLVPLDFKPTSEVDLKYSSYSASQIRDKLEASGARLRIVILDACRNNPFRRKRGGPGGLAAMNSDAEGTLIAFATGDNNVADDNSSESNGLFTKYLAETIAKPGLSLDEIFRTVKRDVYTASNRKQNPFTYDNIIGQFYFQPVDAAPPATGSDTSLQMELTYWISIKDSRNPKLFEAYLGRYPNGQFSEIARELRGAEPTLPATQPAQSLQPGAVKTNSKDGQRYVWIPAGTFTMGCSPGDGECVDSEKPAHEVTISKGFWLGQTEVKVSGYKRFVQESGRGMPPEPGDEVNTGWGKEQLPIVDVNWDDAAAYCVWAGLRLPTEAEWEYAARAESKAARYADLDSVAWFADNSGNTRIDSTGIFKSGSKNYGNRLQQNGNKPHSVAQKRPNTWSLYDMLGNVWEWTADWYNAEYYKISEKQDPQGSPGGQYRVLRGGSWWDYPRGVRLSVRVRGVPGDPGSTNNGFRCAGELP